MTLVLVTNRDFRFFIELFQKLSMLRFVTNVAIVESVAFILVIDYGGSGLLFVSG